MKKKQSLFSLFFDQFKRFDSNAPPVGFTLAGEDSVPSAIGGIISLVTTFFAFYLSYHNLYDFVFRTNAEVSIGSKFENANLEFDSETMFMSLGFYFPFAQTSANLDAGTSESFNVEDNIPEVNVTCVDCNNNNTQLVGCQADKFKNVVISSISVNQSNQILNNLKKYSFCLPEKYSGKVVEEVPFGKSASIEMVMPFNRTVPPKTPSNAAKLIQTGGYSFNDVKDQINTIDTTRDQIVSDTENKQANAENQYNSLVESGYDPEEHKPNTCAVEDDECQAEAEKKEDQQSEPEEPNEPTQNNGQDSPTSSPTNEPQDQENTGGENQGGGGAVNDAGEVIDDTVDDTVGGAVDGAGGVIEDAVDDTVGGAVDGAGGVIEDAVGGLTGGDDQNGDQGGTDTGGGLDDLVDDPAGGLLGGIRRLRSKRKLAQQCSCMQASDYLKTQDLPWELKNLVSANLFPKLLYLHRTVTVNPNNEEIVSFVYNLNVLDFYDRFTSNPIVYDVYVRKVVVEKVTGIFWEETEEAEYLEFEKIEANRMDSLTNKGAKFYFKISSNVKTITVKYVTFADWLESFGAYIGVFGVVASVLSGIVADKFFYSKAVNSIFKFNRNKLGRYEPLKSCQSSSEGNLVRRADGHRSFTINENENRGKIRISIVNSPQDVRFSKAFILNRRKKKENKRVFVSSWDMFKAAWCSCLFTRQRPKFEVVAKCQEVIDKCLSVEQVSRTMFELNLIKEIFFSKYERALLKYQLRYLNLEDEEKTLKYLDHLVGKKVSATELKSLREGEFHESEEFLIKYLEEYYAY